MTSPNSCKFCGVHEGYFTKLDARGVCFNGTECELRLLMKQAEKFERALRQIMMGKLQEDNEHPNGVDFSMAARFMRIAKEALE